MIWLSEAGLNERVVEMTARFDHIGETTVRDEGSATDYRWLQWLATCPYSGLDLARFQYDEYYERSGGGWQMVKYAYDFLESRRSSRLSFHHHPVIDPVSIPHAHCEPEVGRPAHEHYRYIELTIHEALEEHMQWWATDTDLSCEGLRPLLSGRRSRPIAAESVTVEGAQKGGKSTVELPDYWLSRPVVE